MHWVPWFGGGNAPILSLVFAGPPAPFYPHSFLGLLQAQNLLDGPGTVPSPARSALLLTLSPFLRLQYLLAMVLVYFRRAEEEACSSSTPHSNLFLALWWPGAW